ncbi:MAG: tetratricopeptide repeat protein [Thermoguttaceae bacterium]
MAASEPIQGPASPARLQGALPDPDAPLPATAAALFKEAAQVAQRLVEHFPNHPDALEIKARVQFWIGNTAEAVKAWEKCLKLDPAYAYAYMGLGSVAVKKGEPRQAAALFRQAYQLNPGSLQAQKELGTALIDAGEPKEAVAVLQRGLASDPEPTGRLVLLGLAHLNLGDYEKAKQYYQAAIKTHPNHANAHYGLATACVRLGLQKEAAEYMARFRKLRAEERQIRKDQRTAYDDAAAMRQDAAKTYALAGQLYLAGGKRVEAEQILQRGALLDPKNIECRQGLAFIRRNEGRTAEAIELLAQIAGLEPKNPIYPLEIGRLQAELDQFDAAEQSFQTVCALAPESFEGPAALAELYLQANRNLPEALRLARKAVQLGPIAPNYALLSRACEKNRDRLGALAAMAQAIRLAPNQPDYRQTYERLKAGQ